MISARPVAVVLVSFLFATCSPVDPEDDCTCPPTHICVAGECVCPPPDKPCVLDCAEDDDSCERGILDPVDCRCKPTGTNTLESLEVTPSAFSLRPGDTRQLTASGTFANGDVLDVTSSVTWTSSNPDVATVTELSGLVTALSVGSSIVTAATGSLEGRATLSVTESGENGPGNGENGEHELVDVSHEREFRGAWVATAWGINFPRTSGAANQQAELIAYLDAFEAFGLNAVVFQVRPEADALYASSIEPWSRFLSGTQGQDPGYDPLQVLIEEARHRNIEVHAWLNPYRALTNRNATNAAAGHVSLAYPQYAYPCGDNLLWMDPGAEPVRDRIVDVVVDLVQNYDVDGIHFDDYFYPWPSQCSSFPDDAVYDAYVSGGGTLDLADFRRYSVDEMIRLVGEAVIAEDPAVRFGVSPFGIYRSGEPPGISGTSQYDVLYSDPKKWMEERWIDYLAPQLYWPTSPPATAYGTLLPWWAGISNDDRYVFAGNALYRLGNSGYTVDEFRLQMEISRDYRHLGSKGNIFYHAATFLNDPSGLASMLRDEFFGAPALTPPVVASRHEVVNPPTVEAQGGLVTMGHGDDASIRAWLLYEEIGDEWVIDRIFPSSQDSFSLPAGRWAISAASWGNVESQGVVVEID